MKALAIVFAVGGLISISAATVCTVYAAQNGAPTVVLNTANMLIVVSMVLGGASFILKRMLGR